MWHLILRACCWLGIHRKPPVPTSMVLLWHWRDCGKVTHDRRAT